MFPHLEGINDVLTRLGVMVLAGWETMLSSLRKYAEPIKTDLTLKDIKRGISLLSDIIIPKIQAPLVDEIDYQYVKPNSYSGVFSAILFGKTKGQSLEIANILAKELFEHVGRSLTVDTTLKTIGGREKLSKSDKIGQVLASRVVIQEDIIVSQLKQIYARPITNVFKAWNKD
jgi:hypothetical protein